MTNPQAISPVVTAFLGLLSQADSVQVGSCPLLSSWDVTEPTGSEDNELVRFCWEDDSLIYAIVLILVMIFTNNQQLKAFFGRVKDRFAPKKEVAADAQ